jgi:hypothetical protein
MPDIGEALTETKDGAILAIEVTAGAKQDLFPAGFNPWRKTVGCRVAAPALEGRANAAVIAAIAGFLQLPSTAISIRSGATSSIKKVHIAGMKKQDLTARIAAAQKK